MVVVLLVLLDRADAREKSPDRDTAHSSHDILPASEPARGVGRGAPMGEGDTAGAGKIIIVNMREYKEYVSTLSWLAWTFTFRTPKKVRTPKRFLYFCLPACR